MNAALPYHDLQTVYYALIAVVLPFAAFVINFCLSDKLGSKISGAVSSLGIGISAVFAIITFSSVWNTPGIHAHQLWFSIGTTQVFAGLWLNNLSVLMLLLVTLVALPVHIYSMAYMKQGEHKRYFSYLSFFCFSMLALVVVDSLITFYAFWELVGFSSYLLIGFWFTRDSAVQANKKAFIMNRVGDVGLLIAIGILFSQYHTFDLVELFGAKGIVAPPSEITSPEMWLRPMAVDHGELLYSGGNGLSTMWYYIAGIGIFLAVAAKSAQFPLHTWLPDAMEGPTSVSSLIHAATMVAAGVFLLGRVYPLFNAIELNVLAVIGCFTAFMAATIALTQNDLKRILAYSTISQLGYMIMAMGIHAYASSLFHLVTHAFFKCLLFLCAGIVIHNLQHVKDEHQLEVDPQDIRNMGGLRKQLPLTFIACCVAGLALVGLPLTSGYLSKDGILIQAFEWSEGKPMAFKLIPISIFFTSALTAFYVARLIFKVFFGEFRLQLSLPQLHFHMDEKGWKYRLPLIILMLFCLFPWFSFNPISYEHSWLFEGFFATEAAAVQSIYHLAVPAGISLVSMLLMYWAFIMYAKQQKVAFPQGGFLYNLSYRQWYIDVFYQKVIVKAVLHLSKLLYAFDRKVIDGFIDALKTVIRRLAVIAAWADRYLVDGFLHLLALLVQAIGNFFRGFQSGKVQYYIYSMLLVLLAVFIFQLLI
ncbi:NADH-quinone oxidoreductase subunit L [Mucilaginibacter koreensis]